MAQTIKIKRSTSAAAPAGALGAGELAYSFNSNKLFIGDGSNNDIIGGQLFTNMLDHAAGTLTASSAIIVDSNSKIDNLLVDNLQLNGNTVSSTSGNLILSSTTGSISVAGAATEILILDGSSTSFTITEGSNNYLTLDTTNAGEKVVLNKQLQLGIDGTPGYTLPTADGSSGQALITNGSGVVSFTTISTILTVGADTGSNDNVSLISDTLTFTGGEGIDTAVTNNTITISGENASTSNKGIASFDATDFTVSSGAVAVNAITLGSSALNPGATTTAIAGLTSLTVDNINVNGNEITSTNTNGNISFNPNGSGVVDVNNSKISNVTDPTATQDAATKGYVDAVKQALDIKDSVRVATTANITIATALNVGDAIDGVTLADGDRVLVKNQTTASQNGIYTAGVSPVRATDANISAEVTSGMFCFVEEGTVGGDNGFVLTTNDPITLDTTALTFVQFSGAGQVIAGDALSKSGNTLNLNDDNITLEVSSDTVRIKGITATAKGDIILGAATNGGYTRHVKPGTSATVNTYLLSMDTSGNAVWGDVIDGGSF